MPPVCRNLLLLVLTIHGFQPVLAMVSSNVNLKILNNKEYESYKLDEICQTTMTECLERCLEHCLCKSFEMCYHSTCRLRSYTAEFNSSKLKPSTHCHHFEFKQENNQQCGLNSCTSVINCCLTSNPCQNGGICLPPKNKKLRFHCKCPEGYEGKRCQICPIGNQNSVNCSDSPCLNGGNWTYEPVLGSKNENSFCKCTSGYEGKNCEMFYPKTCKDYQNNGRNKTNGEYIVYLMRPECNQTVKIYCADMNTSMPLEYVTLPAGDVENFAVHYSKTEPFEREETKFEKIRILVPKRIVDTHDFRFATTNVPNRHHSFASAYDCMSQSCQDTARKGEFRVNVTGTGFRLPHSISYIFNCWPACTKKVFYPSMSDDFLRWSGKCGGYCGECNPSEFVLEINGC